MSFFINESLYSVLKYGVFAVHKQKGITSAKTLDAIKSTIVQGCSKQDPEYILRAGHGGTLDSSATGVLVVGLCRGCKFLKYLLKGNKKYEVTGVLGISTDTYNSYGKITGTSDYSHVKQEDIEGKLKQYVGNILQVPPKFSALKKDGVRVSDLTLKGVDVHLAPRRVICHEARCLDFSPPFFKLYVSTGPGFYIRSLVHDLGKDVGTDAYVEDLTRTEQEPFQLEDCLKMDSLNLEDIIESVQLNQKRFSRLSKAIKRMENKRTFSVEPS